MCSPFQPVYLYDVQVAGHRIEFASNLTTGVSMPLPDCLNALIEAFITKYIGLGEHATEYFHGHAEIV